MRRLPWLFGSCVLVLTGVLLLSGRAMPAAQSGVGMTGMTGAKLVPQVTPTCTAHTTDMTLTASSRVPEVGDRVWVTATLTNEGCGRVGLPEYRLSLVQAPYILVPDSPTSVTHHVALEFGEMDVVTFSLQTLGVGEVVLQASTSLDYYHA